MYGLGFEGRLQSSSDLRGFGALGLKGLGSGGWGVCSNPTKQGLPKSPPLLLILGIRNMT